MNPCRQQMLRPYLKLLTPVAPNHNCVIQRGREEKPQGWRKCQIHDPALVPFLSADQHSRGCIPSLDQTILTPAVQLAPGIIVCNAKDGVLRREWGWGLLLRSWVFMEVRVGEGRRRSQTEVEVLAGTDLAKSSEDQESQQNKGRTLQIKAEEQ